MHSIAWLWNLRSASHSEQKAIYTNYLTGSTICHPVLVEAVSPACHSELIPVCVKHNQLGDVLPGLVEKAGEATILFLHQKWSGTCIHLFLCTNLYKKL